MAIKPGSLTFPVNIDGRSSQLCHWFYVTEPNYDQYIFTYFIDGVFYNLETRPASGDIDDRRYFLWDNLSSHKTPYVNNKTYARPTYNEFISVDRPPY